MRLDDERPFRLITFGAQGLQPGTCYDRLKDHLSDEDAANLKSEPAARPQGSSQRLLTK
jgi:hypothetical protein